jgi:hypothetical protein
MTRRKTWRTMTADEREAYERRIDETLELIQKRRAFHQAKISEAEALEQRRRELAELGIFRRLARRLAA